ncbi:phosphatase PAP2 family protein [Ureibacillus thermophilus]|uniref:phosphatase PAP2 family protein n=1 Tax=Ureibacillus thermophilus TaxID=367743 RepID=UPI003612E558
MNKRLFVAGFIAFILFLILRYVYDLPIFVSFDKNMQALVGENSFIGSFHYLGELKVISLITLILLGWLGFKHPNNPRIIFVLFTIPVGFLLNQLMKNWVKRPRPEIENQLSSYSFPSGHAMLGLLYLLTIAFLLSERTTVEKKKWWIWIVAITLAFFIGLSRVAESRHFATDVMAGWCLGVAWFCLCVYWYINKSSNQLKRD